MKKKRFSLKNLTNKLSFFSKHPWIIFLFLVFLGAFVSWQTFAAGTTYTWTNTGGDNLWENANNWSPVGVPGTQDLVVFNSTSVDDCFIYSNINIANFNIQSTYTGNIEHGTDYTFAITTFSQAGGTLSLNSGGTFSSTASLTGGVLNIGSKNITFSNTFSQSSGTVNGGSGNITFSSTFTLSGGTFNASESSIYFDNSFTHTGGTFDGDAGTVQFRGTNNTFNISASTGNTVTFNDVVINLNYTSYYLTVNTGDKLIVNGTTTLREGIYKAVMVIHHLKPEVM
jgi:hypothetical protein